VEVSFDNTNERIKQLTITQDLDGDLYDVFWDPRIMPPKLFMPAEYPRLPAIDIGRQVTAQDISKHFIDFMKNDNIGLLANQLLVVSDRMPTGSMDENCIAISELMSTALDYPKTGIVVCDGCAYFLRAFWQEQTPLTTLG